MRGYENMTEAEIAARNARIKVPTGRRARLDALMKSNDPELIAAILKPPKPSKYRNVKCVVDGERFDSQAEAKHWQALKYREKAGEIEHVYRQVHFSLCCIGVAAWNIMEGATQIALLGKGPEIPASSSVVADYIADFVFIDAESGQLHVQDVKGGKATKTAIYQLKKKWLYLQSGIEIEEIG